ncbi:MAG: TetR family transcriptional regulator [Novosphingobium sp.]|uniref:TetR/AcrR family transcriptional regulator n=1 Tax=Novosphingobium sp. TaxID=1874826 RepID=UPI001DA8E2DA|nr:TetR/AcrR family transcriptional regulator [Novosphingobium sp.]MCB2056498.1 TetR family transcriptional regulator [Novosphingobium sp.]MCP5387778.1 TetR family transcriptional regulator [Novosphingobium sp.]
MKRRSATANRIVEAGRKAFNLKGYVAASVTEIAASLNISQGNLTYHFPTKRELAMAIEDDALQIMKERRNRPGSGALADDYAEHLLFWMDLTWRYRFIMRDRVQYADQPLGKRPDSRLLSSYDELLGLLHRAGKQGILIENHGLEIDVLARSLWIVSRHWVDSLRELEGLDEPDWSDQERGIRHHMAILSPCLKAKARREFEAALKAAMLRPGLQDPADGSVAQTGHGPWRS